MASWVIKNISGRTSKAIDISLIVGMVAYDGISIAVHEGFVELQRASMPKEISKFSCSYICELPAVHTNLFTGLKMISHLLRLLVQPILRNRHLARIGVRLW